MVFCTLALKGIDISLSHQQSEALYIRWLWYIVYHPSQTSEQPISHHQEMYAVEDQSTGVLGSTPFPVSHVHCSHLCGVWNVANVLPGAKVVRTDHLCNSLSFDTRLHEIHAQLLPHYRHTPIH